MKENYEKLEPILLEGNVMNNFKKYYRIEEAQQTFESGIDPNSAFYEELYQWLYPKVKY